ncbi:hypothetical protein HY970_02245 [Candidatus Kaiserbacteria bacterium]|nr:hypothetical protein [Candidatus Kaiserbacteria bacterium]
MADTIVNTPGANRDEGSALGWVVVLIVLLAVIVAAVLWYRNATPAPSGSTSNINVTIPNTGGDGGGSSGGTSPGGSPGGSTGY